MKKPILCPERIREVPSQFSWVDHRLVRERHICGKSPSALGLYLFLCTVADAQGLSYYSDPSIGKLLGYGIDQLESARSELIRSGMVAYRPPFYQVLSLDAPRRENPCSGKAEPERRGETQSAAQILERILKS
jgi:hypothetical protein